MIAIPNMSKPKSCWECRLMDGEANCLVTDEGIPFKQEGILPDCPLIEIDEKAFNEVIKGYLEGLKAIQNGERRSDE